jgi:hypothetical protein
MAINAAREAPPEPEPDTDVHVYRATAANRAVFPVLSVILFCFALFLRHHLVTLDRNATDALREDLIVFVPLLSVAVFLGIRLSKLQVTLTNSQIEIVGIRCSYIVPFTEISGRRCADGRGGIYLYRRGKSRIYVRGWLRQDDFYKRWRDSLCDLDKADRLKRKAAGKERLTDSFFDDVEQHSRIGSHES